MVSGIVVIMFSVWWLYFSREAGEVLSRIQGRGTNTEYAWGFGHYLIFAAAAAIGAGLAARVEHWLHPEISALVTGAAITIPVAALLATMWLVHLRGHDPSLRTAVPFGAAVLLILAGTFIPYPELSTAIVVVILLVVEVSLANSQHAADVPAEV